MSASKTKRERQIVVRPIELLRYAKKDKRIVYRILKEICIGRRDFKMACEYRDLERDCK